MMFIKINKEIKLEPTNPAPPVTTIIFFLLIILFYKVIFYLINSFSKK